MTNADFYLAPKLVTVRFALSPALNSIHSLGLLLKVDHLSGLDEWVTQAAARLSPEQRHNHRIVIEGFNPLFYERSSSERNWPDFTAYIDYLAAQDPVALRDDILETLRTICIHESANKAQIENLMTEPDELLADVNAYIRLMNALDEEETTDDAFLIEVHTLLNNPPALQNLVVSHLRAVWNDFFCQEWQRVLPSLKASIAAFQKLDFSYVTAREAVRIVTGREIPAPWEERLAQVDQITFIPSAHIGPYISLIHDVEPEQRIFFGAHLPAQAAFSTLSRSELLVRLNALADETRLRILELLTQESELPAQEIMARLDLGQSSVSRHLSQLAGIGLIMERRREIAKWYRLNPARIEDTLNALAHFLKK